MALQDTDQKCHVQKALLSTASDCFIKALQLSFREGQEGVLHLPGCKQDTFELFLYWICHHKLPDLVAARGAISEGRESRKLNYKQQERMVLLWVFGDACIIPRLQNAAMQSLLKLLHGAAVSVQAVCLAWEFAPADSILKEVMTKDISVDIFYNRRTEEEMISLGSLPGFLQRLTDDYVMLAIDDEDQPIKTSGNQEDYSEYMVPESGVF